MWWQLSHLLALVHCLEPLKGSDTHYTSIRNGWNSDHSPSCDYELTEGDCRGAETGFGETTDVIFGSNPIRVFSPILDPVQSEYYDNYCTKGFDHSNLAYIIPAMFLWNAPTLPVLLMPLLLMFSTATSAEISPLDDLRNTAFYSLYTDGAKQFANTAIPLPQFPEIQGSANRTYCLSAKFLPSLSDPDHDRHCLLSTGFPSNSNAFNIVKYTAHLGVMGYNDDWYPTTGSVTCDFEEWNHFCVTFDGSDITVYVNGEVDNIEANPSLSTAAAASQTNYVGQSNHLVSPYPFYGSIANIRLFSTVLTQTDIQLLTSTDNSCRALDIDSFLDHCSSLWDERHDDINGLRDQLTEAMNTTAENISINQARISNNTLRVSTNAADIDTNTEDIGTNTEDITTNKEDIESNNVVILNNTERISSNKVVIGTNTGSISSNKGVIDDNTANINTNTKIISNNTESILSNAADIGTNAESISTNTADISTNEVDISRNRADIESNNASISTNKADIGTNEEVIDTNMKNIESNEAVILNNTESIASNEGVIGSNTAAISSNTADISSNAADIDVNTVNISNIGESILTHDGRLTANEDNITTLYTRIGDIIQDIDVLSTGLEAAQEHLNLLSDPLSAKQSVGGLDDFGIKLDNNILLVLSLSINVVALTLGCYVVFKLNKWVQYKKVDVFDSEAENQS